MITALGSKLPTAGGSITGNLDVSGRIATDRIIAGLAGLVTVDDNMTVTGSLSVQDGGFSIQDDVDSTKRARFLASSISTNAIRNYT